MGFFSDLFKEKTKWSYSELQALWATTYGLASVDGNVDENEQALIENYMNKLPSLNVVDWTDFIDKALEIPMNDHLETLKSMHKDKKKLALACLMMIAVADDKVDEKEQEAINNLKLILGVSL